MTIDESIGWIKKTILDMRRAETCISDRLALETAIDTMRKYQKIEDIVRDYYNEQYTDKLDIEIIEMISEVLGEDGRWEN